MDFQKIVKNNLMVSLFLLISSWVLILFFQNVCKANFMFSWMTWKLLLKIFCFMLLSQLSAALEKNSNQLLTSKEWCDNFKDSKKKLLTFTHHGEPFFTFHQHSYASIQESNTLRLFWSHVLHWHDVEILYWINF